MKRDILLMGTAREKSTRIKNKMTRPFGDTSLYEIYLEKLESISGMKNPFTTVIMALNRNDKILWNKSKHSKIKIVERSKFSAGDVKLPADIYHYLEDFDEQYVMWVNGCSAFLNPQTINKLAEFFIKNTNLMSLTVVKKRFNWFWDTETKKPITCGGKSDGSTELCKPLYENVNCLHIHSIKTLLEENLWWHIEENDPYLYVVEDSTEFLDVDSLFDFEIAEAVWKGKK